VSGIIIPAPSRCQTRSVVQKKDIKRQKERLEALKKEAEQEKARAKEAARERVLADFEKGQLALAAVPAVTTSGTEATGNVVHITFPFLYDLLSFYNLLLSGRGIKRKFAFDATAAEKVAQEAEEAALRQIEREQAAALRSKLPDFWLPSLTPTYTSSGPPSSLADVKLQTTCRGGNPPHPIAYARSTRIFTTSLLIPPFRLKTLVPVNFTFQPKSSRSQSTNSTPADDGASNLKGEERDTMCPSCKKDLSNSVRIYGTSLWSIKIQLLHFLGLVSHERMFTCDL
jgi:nitric oxide synthase-interacting protein